MLVRVVTDSAADIPPEMVKELSITVVPDNVHFGQRTFQDGIDLTSEEFFAKLAGSPVIPTTSQPSVGVFEDVYRRLADETNQIISIHLPAKMSAVLTSARSAAQALPGVEIVRIDSGQVSMAMGWLVITAARAARQGKTLAEIVALVEQTRPRLRLIAMLESLEYLQKGGRIGKAQALLGTAMRMKPLIQVLDGEALPVQNVRTRSAALARLVEIVSAMAPLEQVAIPHANVPDLAQRLAAMLTPIFPLERILIYPVGAILGTHIGPGAVGVACVLAAKSEGPR